MAPSFLYHTALVRLRLGLAMCHTGVLLDHCCAQLSRALWFRMRHINEGDAENT